jgi:hypothetical protein
MRHRSALAAPAALAALVALALAAGCSSVATQARSSRYSAATEDRPAAGAPLSLFPSDEATLGDADIARILAARPALGSHLRVAVLHLEHQSNEYGWLRDDVRTPTTWLLEKLFATLRGAEGVEDASFLPSFLVPQKITVGHLREAAARYQADLLLVFRSECRTHEEFRVFRPSLAKAFCLADAGVLDVRTGIISFTSRALEEFTIVEEQSELDLMETVRRSEKIAVEAAMAENGQNFASFVAAIRRTASR